MYRDSIRHLLGRMLLFPVSPCAIDEFNADHFFLPFHFIFSIIQWFWHRPLTWGVNHNPFCIVPFKTYTSLWAHVLPGFKETDHILSASPLLRCDFPTFMPGCISGLSLPLGKPHTHPSLSWACYSFFSLFHISSLPFLSTFK